MGTIIAKRGALEQALKAIKPAINKKASVPILRGCFICITKEMVFVYGTDLEIAIRSIIDINGYELEDDMKIVVEYERLLNTIKALKTDKVEITSEGNKVIINHAITLDTFSVDDYPVIRDFYVFEAIMVNRQEFLNAYDIIKDTIKVKTGIGLGDNILLNVKDDQLIACNGYYMGISKFQTRRVNDDKIPYIVKLNKKVFDTIRLVKNKSIIIGFRSMEQKDKESPYWEGNVIIKNGDVKLNYMARHIDYPDYNKIITEKTAQDVNCIIPRKNVEALISALDVLSIQADEYTRKVNLKIWDGILGITVPDGDTMYISIETDGEVSSLVNIDYFKTIISLNALVNIDYFKTIIKSLNAGDIRLTINPDEYHKFINVQDDNTYWLLAGLGN